MLVFNGPVVPFARGGAYEIKAAEKDSAEIWLYDVIGDSWDGTTAKKFGQDLKAIGDVSTLNIFINSPGGSVFDGVAIYNVLKRHKARKNVHVDGMAASIASVVAMAGDEINIAANAYFMIHNPWAHGAGEAADFRKMADALDKIRGGIMSSYLTRATATEDELSEWMDAETWFSAEEAVEAGLADTVTDEVEIAAFSNIDLSKFKHPPEELATIVAEAPTPEPTDSKPHSAVAIMEARAALSEQKRRPSA